MSEVLWFLLQSKIGWIAFSIIFVLRMTLSLLATFNYSAKLPMRGEFYTNSRHVDGNKNIFYRPVDPPGMLQTSA